MEVKRLGATDAEYYWNLRLEALQKNPEAFITTYDEAMQRQKPIETVAERLSDDSAFTYGAYENQQLLGVVTFVPGKHKKFEHKGEIFAMYVSPAARGKGVGRALIQACIVQAKSSSIEQIQLSVVSTNKPAKLLYEAMGFESYGEEKKAIKLGKEHYLDEDMMVLFLDEVS